MKALRFSYFPGISLEKAANAATNALEKAYLP